MSQKKTVIILILFVSLLSALLSSPQAASSGKTENLHLFFSPIIYNPPGPSAWIGPDGGSITTIAVAASQPKTIYAGTWGSGVYKSQDGGLTWVWKSRGLEQPYLYTVAVDPNDPDVVYAGTYTGKIYKTTNGGDNWFPSSDNIQDHAIVYGIVIDPIDTENIFITTRGVSNNGGPPWNGVIYHSTDAGSSWKPILNDVGGPSQEDWFYAITLHPKFPNLLYGATHEHGIYRSINTGKDWEPVNNGITSMSTRGIVVDPNSSKEKPVLHTGVWKWEGVFRSNNGGDDWFPVDKGSKGTRIFSMSINPKDSNTIYASTFSGGVLKTNNGGSSWFITGLAEYEVPVTAIDPQNPQLLYSGSMGNGLFKSYDSGENWQPSHKGLHATNISALQISFGESAIFYAGLYGDGVKRSLDAGNSWEQFGTGLGDPNILELVIPPNQPHVLFSLTETDGLYRCTIGGNCWEKIDISFPNISQAALQTGHLFSTVPFLDDEVSQPDSVSGTPALLDLCFVPSFPQIVYLGTAGAGVYRSLDGGSTWNPTGISSGKIVALAVDLVDPFQVYAASESQIWNSTNGGSSWIDTGLSGVTIYALATDSNSSFYAGTNNGVYKYSQVGWNHLGLAGLTVTEVESHLNQPDWLYAGTNDGLRISHDNGITWNRGPNELEGTTIQAITFDPNDPSWMFISTASQGIYRMQDWE